MTHVATKWEKSGIWYFELFASESLWEATKIVVVVLTVEGIIFHEWHDTGYSYILTLIIYGTIVPFSANCVLIM